MHIGMFAPAAPSSGSANGIVTYARIMAGTLAELGHRVTVISPGRIDHPDGRVETVTSDGLGDRIDGWIERLRGDHEYPLRRHRWLRRVVCEVHRRDPLDVFELEESFGWAGHLAAPCPVVVRLHGPHFVGKDMDQTAPREAASQRRIAAERTGIERATAITSPSSRLLDATLAFYGLRPTRAVTIPNPMPLAMERWAAAHADMRQVLFVGRFDLRKGVDIAIAAFAEAARTRPDARLVIVGPDEGIVGVDGKTVHFAQYAATAIPPTVRAQISFRGRLAPDEVHTLRLASAVNLSCSRFEVFPYSVAEAMSLGAPSIVSDVFGNGEFLVDRSSAFVVPVGDVAATAQAIGMALDQPELTAAVASKAREVCATVLDPTRIAQDTAALYRSLVVA